MSKLALYRKYRPTNFDEIFGQDHISITLKNSVKNKNFSHAYLFYGPRGTGKTSAARVLAKAINCQHSKDGNPDNSCDKCLSINENKTVDIIEIDAASYTGIDNIREVIIERANFAPTNLDYKVYIIDEAHMLSKSSFNALLKTLEEPPEHAIFILATTEIHKIIPTVQSRCQKYDFHKIDNKSIYSRLEYIAKKEGIKIEPVAIDEIVRISDGGFRDAISILDQLADIPGGAVTQETVRSLVGSGNQSQLKEVVTNLLNKNTTETLNLVNAILESGVDPSFLMKEIIITLRDFAVDFFSKSKEKKDDLNFEIDTITRAIDVFIKTESDYRYINMPKLTLEVSIIKFTKDLSSSPINHGVSTTSKKQPTHQTTSVSSPSATDKTKWQQFLLEVKTQNNSIHAVLKVCTPEFNGTEVCLYFPYKFHKERVDERKNMQLIEESFEKVYGKKLKIQSILKASNIVNSSNTKNVSRDDLLDDAIGIFGGEVID